MRSQFSLIAGAKHAGWWLYAPPTVLILVRRRGSSPCMLLADPSGPRVSPLHRIGTQGYIRIAHASILYFAKIGFWVLDARCWILWIPVTSIQHQDILSRHEREGNLPPSPKPLNPYPLVQTQRGRGEPRGRCIRK